MICLKTLSLCQMKSQAAACTDCILSWKHGCCSALKISNREHSRELIQQQGFGTLLQLLEDWDEDILQDTETTSRP